MFNKPKKVLFIDPQMDQIASQGDAGFDIILSPALYWVQKLQLPIKYTHQVKKLIPSLFEDILPEGNYSYTVFKIDDDFFIFAYQDKKIIDLLAQKGIDVAQVAGVYFAQTELMSQLPSAIDENQVLIEQDGIISIAPKKWVEDTHLLELEDLKLSNNKIHLQHYAHIIEKSSITKLVVVMSLFIVILSVEWFVTDQKIMQIEEEKSQLFSKYNLLPTMLQNRSIHKRYKKIFEKQTKLREYIAAILRIKLQKKQKITLVALEQGVLHVTISGATKNLQNTLAKQLKAAKKKLNTQLQGDLLDMKVQL